ncbi:MAG: hypothetical protein V1754_06800 [Pseudomonadota bacterium]
MRRFAIGLAALGAMFLFVACGSDGEGGKKDTGPGTDGTVQLDGNLGGENITGDGAQADMPQGNPAKIGLACKDDADCGDPSVICLGLSETQGGICTFNCIPDDPETQLINEDSCPEAASNLCGVVMLNSGESQGFCFRKCQPKLGGNDCAPEFSCAINSMAYFENYVADAVCMSFGCETGADCPVITAQTCDTQTGTCPTGETCLPLAADSTAGRCAKDGVCDTTSRLCGPHNQGNANAQVGDPCTSTTDCGNNMMCSIEYDSATTDKKGGEACEGGSECCSGECDSVTSTCVAGPCLVRSRGGYCMVLGCGHATLTEFACPAGSACNRFYYGGICQKSCALATATDCRGNAGDLYGDYECRDYSSLINAAQVPMSDGPVCEWGPNMRCTYLAHITDNCAVIGDVTNGNATNMKCRDIFTKAEETNLDSTSAFCFDDTASGEVARTPQ